MLSYNEDYENLRMCMLSKIVSLLGSKTMLLIEDKSMNIQSERRLDLFLSAL